ncbi:reverse transcriptase domain-containing protein [Tanacetum coccineum]
MRTRSQSRNLHHQQQQAPPAFVEPFNLEEPIENPAPPVVTMDDNRTMAQLLEAPTEGYEDAIVVPEITADNFELKHGLLNLVQNKQFFGHDKEDPHAHIRYFNKITSTMKFPNVPSTSVKLMLFPFSLEGAARIWLEKEPPRSIQTWDDLVSKFINKFFPPSKTTTFEMKSRDFNKDLMRQFYDAWIRVVTIWINMPRDGEEAVISNSSSVDTLTYPVVDFWVGSVGVKKGVGEKKLLACELNNVAKRSVPTFVWWSTWRWLWGWMFRHGVTWDLSFDLPLLGPAPPAITLSVLLDGDFPISV